MLRGAMNPALEACKLFDPDGQGLAYEVSLACGSTILHFTATEEGISTYIVVFLKVEHTDWL